MSDTMYTSGHRTITALFDTRGEADAAVERLVSAGIDRSEITVKAGAASSATTTSGQQSGQEMGFWESLKDLFVPDEDRATYAEGLRRGGHVVVVRASDTLYERALDILDDEGTVNLDERAETWRSEGWTGYSAASTTGAATGVAMGARSDATLGVTGRSSATASTLNADGEEVIPVVEEQLRVGKREVEHGRVRVRSYMVETPVQEQVSLRQEHVTIERRPVDRAVTGSEALFQDRTIEAEERSEEAVISKDARVKEELVIGKTANQRTETVSDSVRRTEVEVEDDRSVVGTSSTATTTSTPRRVG